MIARPSFADRVSTVRCLEQERVHQELRARMFDAAVAPTQVGRFVLRRRLGSGAAGVVYAAHDPQLDREVAVKLILSGGTDEDGLLAEARALARFSHPNLLPVFEVGSHDGVPFIVSELVEGGSLRGWLDEPHPAADALALVIAVGRGIGEAHRRGIVHRDLKPENLLVGADGRPRVADFGLALGFESPAGEGALPGTPAYMAPEHLAGLTADPRSDQYSFCVLAFEVLFGRYPTERERAAVPADHPLAAVWPVLARGLAPAPEARWPTMDAIVGALAERAQAPARRRRRRIAVALAAVAAVALALGIWLVVGRDDRAPAPAPDPDRDRELYTEVAPLLQSGRYDECADRLASRATTHESRWLWLQCALQSTTLTRLEAVCATWAHDSPSTLPEDCDAEVMRARHLAAAGEFRACAELIFELPASTAARVLLSRCTGETRDYALLRRACIWMQRGAGVPSPEAACGAPP